MERSLNSLTGMAASALGSGSYAAMRQATSPRGILAFLINLFTCGSVRLRNERQYQELVEAMAEALKKSMFDRNAPLPENLILDDIDGCRVEFSLPGDNNETGHVIVCVSKGGNSEMREISTESFEKACRALQFRNDFSLPQSPIILTPQGGMYLKDVVLSKKNLTGENLRYADLSGAALDDTVLFMADLEGANLKGANLSDGSLGNCNFTGACLENAIMSCAIMDGSNLTGANLQFASLLACNMMECNLSGANMDHANCLSATFIDANLSDATLKYANMMDAKFNGAILARANLQNAILNYANLQECDLSQANLKNTSLENCTLTHSNIEGARMSTSTQTLFSEFYSEDF